MNDKKQVIITIIILLIMSITVPVFAVNNVNTNTQTNSTITKEDIKLKNIQIEGKSLEPAFDKDTYQYKVYFEGEETKLNITAEPIQEDAEVSILGNENLVDGKNTVTIIVTDEKENNANTYQIDVEKNVVVQNSFDTTQIKKIIQLGIIAFIVLVSFIIIILLVKGIRKSARDNKRDENIERKKRIQAINDKISKQYVKENKRNKKNGKHSK